MATQSQSTAKHALCLLMNVLMMWVWWSVIHGGVKPWVGWTFFGLTVFAAVVNLMVVVIRACDD